MRKPPASPRGRTHAFAIWDFLGVLVAAAFMAMVGLAWADRIGGDSRGVVCLANLRQLGVAWSSFAADHGGRLPGSGIGGIPISTNSWAPGWLDFTRSSQNFDVAGTLGRGQLWGYMGGNSRAYRCPDDPTGLRIGNTFQQRIRSYSMNGQISGGGDPGLWNRGGPWVAYTNLAQFTGDNPARRFVFTEEHPGSINDDMMVVDMTGYPDGLNATRMVDFPAAFHAGSGAFCFADQHAELKVWVDSRTSPAAMDRVLVLNIPQPGNQDIRWMQERATRAQVP